MEKYQIGTWNVRRLPYNEVELQWELKLIDVHELKLIDVHIIIIPETKKKLTDSTKFDDTF